MKKLAVDTNVLVRLLSDDGSDQSMAARSLFRAEDIFLSCTVLLETEWVLRSRYALPAVRINDLLSSVLVMPNVEFENDEPLRNAIFAHREGMDFADARHLFLAGNCEAFATFDRDLVRKARRIPSAPAVRQL